MVKQESQQCKEKKVDRHIRRRDKEETSREQGEHKVVRNGPKCLRALEMESAVLGPGGKRLLKLM